MFIKRVLYFPRTKLTYHSAGATAVTSGGVTSVELSHVDSGALYADPKAIEHQQTSTGDEYAMVSSNTKAKKKAPSRVSTMGSWCMECPVA